MTKQDAKASIFIQPGEAGFRGGQVGMVRDSDIAHVVANEMDQMYTNLLTRERHLLKLTEEGLTERQAFYLELTNGLIQKFPDAFEKRIDNQGRTVYEMFETGANGDIYYLTEEGIVAKHNGDGENISRDNININVLTDLAAKLSDDNDKFPLAGLKTTHLVPRTASLFPEQDVHSIASILLLVNMKDENDRLVISFLNRMGDSDRRGRDIKRKRESATNTRLVDSILSRAV